MKILRNSLVAFPILCASSFASAQSVQIQHAWIRGTVPAQKSTGAFMDITAKSNARLVAVESAAAGMVQIHSMKMENGVMKMFEVDGVDIPAGKTVKLAPGGYHVMMMGLKQQMKPGDTVPLTLVFEHPDKKREAIELKVEVRDLKSAVHGRH